MSPEVLAFGNGGGGRESCDLSRSDCFGELAAGEAEREEKSSKKYRGAKRVGERLKLLSRSS